MGAFGSHQEFLREEEIEGLVETSGLSHNEIAALFDRFKSLDRAADGYITRAELLKLPELSMNPLRDRILSQFKLNEKDNINFTDFVKAIAPFRANANLLEKTRQAFKVFDWDEDGFVSKKELQHTLQLMTGSHMTEEELGDMAEQMIRECDEDGDGQLSYSEFEKGLKGINVQEDFTIGPWKED